MKKVLANKVVVAASEKWLKRNYPQQDAGEFQDDVVDPLLDRMKIEVDYNNCHFYHHSFNTHTYRTYTEQNTKRWIKTKRLELVIIIADCRIDEVTMDAETYEVYLAAITGNVPVLLIDEDMLADNNLTYLDAINASDPISGSCKRLIDDDMDTTFELGNLNLITRNITMGHEFETLGQYNLGCAHKNKKKVNAPIHSRVHASVKHTRVEDLAVQPTSKVIEPEVTWYDDEFILLYHK
jgi:hypothetical protein